MRGFPGFFKCVGKTLILLTRLQKVRIMKKEITQDGSITFYNEKYKDIYHSMSGAKTEAIEKFVRPLELKEYIINKKELNILDVCFGIGYTSAAILDELLSLDFKGKINIIGLENDINILNKINEVDIDFKSYFILRNMINNKLNYNYKNISIKLLLDDARISVKQLLAKKMKFDIVLFDPFAPSKQPELWSYEFIKDISDLMLKGAKLTTYSCAKIVRKRMIDSGLFVKDGPCVGRKSPSTIAIKI